MSKVRKTNQTINKMINVSKSSDKVLSRYEDGSDLIRYSGSDPQVLPFPPELVARILGYLDRACDKRNARLVCKGFAAAGLSSLTSKVYFSTSLIGIDYSSKDPHCSSPTLDIAMHPVVSKYITTMVCEGTQISPSLLRFSTFQEWWLGLCKPQMDWPIEMIYHIYTSRHAQEECINQKGEDRKIFYKALQNFPKLDCIKFRDVKTNGPGDWPRPPWPSAIPKGDLWSSSSPYHNFAMCIRVLSKMEIKLRELHITGRDYAISLGVFARAEPTDYNHLLNVFKFLRKVNLNVNTHQDTYALNFAGLGRILTSAIQLQSLDLKCHSNVLCQSRLSLSRLFQDFTWPHLNHFGLSGFRLYSDVDLIAFFHRHQATLDSVSLTYMFLHQHDIDSPVRGPCEAWRRFFDELRRRSIKFHHLHLYRIHDCRNSELAEAKLDMKAGFGDKVLRYLNHGGTNPLEAGPVTRQGF